MLHARLYHEKCLSFTAMRVQSNFPQQTTKMPWFGSRLQDAVVNFLLVVKERNMRERAKIVTREESDRRLGVF